jgi:hypothetical protein
LAAPDVAALNPGLRLLTWYQLITLGLVSISDTSTLGHAGVTHQLSGQLRIRLWVAALRA